MDVTSQEESQNRPNDYGKSCEKHLSWCPEVICFLIIINK